MLFKIITLFIFLSVSELKSLNCSETLNWIKSGYWYSRSEFPVVNINSALFTHLICAFAKINFSSYELSLPSSDDEPYVSTFTEIVKRKNPSVTTLLSIWVGDTIGDENSTNFFSMINQSDNRKYFIESSIKTARLYGFQGLDLWCCLLQSTGTNMTNLGTFFDEWRAAINAESRNSTNSTLTLIMTGRYSPEKDSIIYPVDSIRRNLNWLHVKTYDYHLPSKENFTGVHAALYDPSSTVNTDYGIKEWIRRGLPASKLVLGLPFHGYAWTLVNPKDNQIGAPARGLAVTADGSMNYKYIKFYMRSYGTASVYNASYVVNSYTIGSIWIGFDDVEAIRTKVAYAKEMGLLGYNVWQVPNDDNWELSMAAQGTQKDQKKKQWLLVIMLPIIAIVILLLGTIMCYSRKRELKSKVMRILATRNKPQSPHLQVFSIADIKAATNNFSSEYKLGEGGFGPVYKGKLPDGQELAVKRLAKTSKQGLEEFKNEVTLTAKLQHVNLVKLLGFCTGREEKVLIYEYMPNKSLDFYLYDPIRKLLLDWEKRVHIIEGITQGLLYLQEYSRLTIVHRDLKASNILLDNEMKPKISDFGIARIFEKDEDEASTGRIVGTYGYVPPEYVNKGIYSKKYDVYSFGVLLLQIISGKKNTCLHGLHVNLSLLEYAYELWRDGKGLEFMDLSLDDASSPCKLIRCLEVALLCVQEKWEERPTMLEVFSMLKNETEFVPTPKRPAFSINKDADEPKKITLQEDMCSTNISTISQDIPR